MSDHIVTEDYKGFQIVLTKHHWFEVRGEGFEASSSHFDSYVNATTAIDDYLKSAEKQRRASVGIAIQMLDEAANDVTIKGIHAAHGTLLGCGESDAVYPNIPWMKDAIIEKRKLMRRVNDLGQRLGKLRVSTRTGHRRLSADVYDAAIATLVFEIENKTKLANDAAPKTGDA